MSKIQPPAQAAMVIQVGQEARVETRLLAKYMGNKHRPLMALVEKYRAQMEGFGKVLFQKAPSTSGRTSQMQRFALLNEDQAYFLLTLSRNSARVVELKARLVRAFRESRHAAQIRQSEYLPAHRAMSDAIQRRAGDSPNIRFVHLNANKELNRVAGVQAGQRASASTMQQSVLAVGSALAAQAVEKAEHGVRVHTAIKEALKPLEGIIAVGCTPEVIPCPAPQ